MKTMDVNITTIAYLRVLIIGIVSTIILMVVEAQGKEAGNEKSWAGWAGDPQKIPFSLQGSPPKKCSSNAP